MGVLKKVRRKASGAVKKATRAVEKVASKPGVASALTAVTGGAAALASKKIRAQASKDFLTGAAVGGAVTGAGFLQGKPPAAAGPESIPEGSAPFSASTDTPLAPGAAPGASSDSTTILLVAAAAVVLILVLKK